VALVKKKRRGPGPADQSTRERKSTAQSWKFSRSGPIRDVSGYLPTDESHLGINFGKTSAQKERKTFFETADALQERYFFIYFFSETPNKLRKQLRLQKERKTFFETADALQERYFSTARFRD
jgi:hypothetical protein